MTTLTKPLATEDVSFHWDDPLRLDLQLSDVEKQVQQKAYEFAQEFLLPRVVEAHRTENYEDIPSLVKELGSNGFLGINLHGFGFRGLNHVCYGLVSRELERVDSAYRTVYSVQSSLATEAIYLNGSEEQKARFLPGLARGELIACFGLTEPDHGSDPGSMETRATKVPGGINSTAIRNGLAWRPWQTFWLHGQRTKRGLSGASSSKRVHPDYVRKIFMASFACAPL